MRKEPDVMKKTNHLDIQAKLFDFALSELVRCQRNSFAPMWTIDSWVKFLIWLSLNCGLSGERDSLENFANALSSPLTIKMRKIFFERTIEDLGLHLIGDPAEPNVLILPVQGDGEDVMTDKACREALLTAGLLDKVSADSKTWKSHDQLISIAWNSSESSC